MKKIYVISRGVYADYRVVAASLDKELAEQWATFMNNETVGCKIDEINLLEEGPYLIKVFTQKVDLGVAGINSNQLESRLLNPLIHNTELCSRKLPYTDEFGKKCVRIQVSGDYRTQVEEEMAKQIKEWNDEVHN